MPSGHALDRAEHRPGALLDRVHERCAGFLACVPSLTKAVVPQFLEVADHGVLLAVGSRVDGALLDVDGGDVLLARLLLELAESL